MVKRSDGRFISQCWKCRAGGGAKGLWRRTRAAHIKKECELCGFIAVHTCQLDLDHMDGNRTNNAPENLQTLCANCHRLKTMRHKDWEQKLSTPKP